MMLHARHETKPSASTPQGAENPEIGGARVPFFGDMSLSRHKIKGNSCISLVARRENLIYIIQQLSADGDLPILGKPSSSDSVMPCVAMGERTITGRRVECAVRSERRRQICPPPSKPSWPLACLPSPPPALSRKKLWSSSRSSKKRRCPSTDTSVLSGARQRTRQKLARPTGGRPC